jgi:hypothetical protein
MKTKLSFVAVMSLCTAAFAVDPRLTAARVVSQTGKISAVAGGKITVAGQSGEQLQASAGQPGQINVGQRVWINPSVSKLTYVDFPIEMSKKSHVGGGDWMETSVKVSNTGIINARTHTWTTSCADGFTGGVRVVLMKKDGNDLYITKLRKYGVNGTCVPSAPSSRNESWDENVPLSIINETAKVAIVHIKKPTDRVDEFLEKAKEVAEIAKTVAEVYSTIAGAGGGQQPGPTGGTTPPQ